MTESIVSVVVERLGILLNEEAEIFEKVRDQAANQVVAELTKIQASLKNAHFKRDKRESVGKWLADARKLAYDAEDLLEGFVLDRKSEGGGVIKRFLKRNTKSMFERRIQYTMTKISELLTRLPSFGFEEEVDESSTSAPQLIMTKKLRRFYSHVVVEPMVVGLEEDVQVLVPHLVNDSHRVVSTIHGMGGLGKTTLAQKIYHHTIIKRHFACLAWVSISQKWDTQYVLQKILLQLVRDPERKEAILQWTVEQLQKEISDIYQTKKCLVVLDDIWSDDTWKDLKAAFSIQGLGVGSKLLLTTRNVGVARRVDLQGFLHQPRLLTKDESWKLLYERAFPKNDPIEPKFVKRMEDLGKEMVSHCGGLPLAVVVLGGILVTKPTLTEWERVHKDIESSIRKGQGMGKQHQNEVQDILVLSFDDLPYQLVSCFMHLSKFPEDSNIETEQLYQLWMAEGLLMAVDRRTGETMMDVAECYLGELVHRSMVQVEYEKEESLLRKFKSCCLHDLMRDLSLKKAKEVDLFKAFDFRHDNNDDEVVESSSSSGNDTRQVIYFGDKGDISHLEVVLPDKKRRFLRSLFFSLDYNSKIPRILSLYFHDFQLLRVLTIEGFTAALYKGESKLSQVIGSLTNLRYLSLKGSSLKINLSYLANLEQLQTLDLRLHHVSIAFFDMANILQKMGQLRHLYLPERYTVGSFSNLSQDKETKKLVLHGLSNLDTLENFDLSVCDVQDLSTLGNLRKLTCKSIDNIENLEHLINVVNSNSNLRYSSLEIEGCDLVSEKGATLLKQMLVPDEYVCNNNIHRLDITGFIASLPCDDNVRGFSSNLNELVLHASCLVEDPMTTLEKYPNLRSLSLRRDVYLGKKMVCSSTGFPKLTRLVLWSLSNLEEWRLDQGGMPKLSQLTINRCGRLQMLPDGLIFLTLLQELHIRVMPEEFCDKVRVVDGTEGQDFYKVRHVSRITL